MLRLEDKRGEEIQGWHWVENPKDKEGPPVRDLLRRGDGTGPTILGSGISALSTLYFCTQGALGFCYKVPEVGNLQARQLNGRVSNPGGKLCNGHIGGYLRKLDLELRGNLGLAEGEKAFYFIPNFCLYIPDGITAENFSFIKMVFDRFVKEKTQSLEKGCKITDKAIVIPAVVSGWKYFEHRHIVAIVIVDDVVYYFDPKGILSKNRQLADEVTLRKILEYVRDKFECREIKENIKTYQLDWNRCGLYVLRWISQLLLERKGKKPFPPIQELPPIDQFRESVFIKI